MSGWSWRKKPAPSQAATDVQRRDHASVPPLGPIRRLFTGWPVVVSPYGPAYETGRAAYAQPPSAAVMQTVFATVGQPNVAFAPNNWVYSYGYLTPQPILPTVSGNPPSGGFGYEQLGSL